MKDELYSFLNEISADGDLQQSLRGMKSAQELMDVGSSRGYDFSESDLINHLAETLTRSGDDLASFLKKLTEDETLQDRICLIKTAEGIVALASQSGYYFTAADLINHFAETLLQADDAQTVILFDSFGWNFAFLPGVIKHVHAPIPTNP